MRKIMFNDHCGLTQAVLDGRKTMTRRIVPQSVVDYYAEEAEDPTMIDAARFEIGEVVAIAQAYKNLDYSFYSYALNPSHTCGILKRHAEQQKGWNNKMFVSAKFMPHHIQITDIKVERLQDISEEDCLREGIDQCDLCDICYEVVKKRIEGKYNFKDCGYCFRTPRKAFASLIDKISGKGTWERNPWVFAYEFELID